MTVGTDVSLCLLLRDNEVSTTCVSRWIYRSIGVKSLTHLLTRVVLTSILVILIITD
jgi:hypothetical protein